MYRLAFVTNVDASTTLLPHSVASRKLSSTGRRLSGQNLFQSPMSDFILPHSSLILSASGAKEVKCSQFGDAVIAKM